jgi:hypothetical protein
MSKLTKFVAAYVYTLSDPTTGEVRYVGKTTNLQKRWVRHIRRPTRDKKGGWVSSIIAQGLTPTIEVLEEIPQGEDWRDVEKFWIGYLRFLGCRLTNLHAGGEGGFTGSHTPETKSKMRIAKLGKPLSPEHRANLSAVRLGMTFSESHCKKIGDANRTRVWSKAARDKIGEANKRRLVSEETKTKHRTGRLGKKHSLATLLKMSAAHLLRYTDATATQGGIGKFTKGTRDD